MSFLLASHKPPHSNFDPISKALRELYAVPLNERIPRDMLDLLARLS